MSKCVDCKYAEGSNYKISNIECCTCSLTRRVMNANADSDCNCFNRDLSEYDICYNCKYYIGGGDWGLFCSHKDMYHHLGKFSDAPCKRYERRTDGRLLDEDAVINAINALHEKPNAWLDCAVEAVKTLPPVQQEQKTALWIIRKWGDDAKCSNCGRSFKDVYDMDNYDQYCRHCGTYMKGIRAI